MNGERQVEIEEALGSKLVGKAVSEKVSSFVSRAANPASQNAGFCIKL
jgi:hypothetical protein